MAHKVNFALIGFPGSGKSFYGREIAKHWGIPIHSASTILRNHALVDTKRQMEIGAFLDDHFVTDTILSFLESNDSQSAFLMDGFPRTMIQLELMLWTWPSRFRIQSAFHLDVPEVVCAQKMAGRRKCLLCGQEPNEAYVRTQGFHLPPMKPNDCHNRCQPSRDWVQRSDDTSDYIIQKRLAKYRTHSKPILQRYEEANELFAFRPYNGAKDVPAMVAALETWLKKRTSES